MQKDRLMAILALVLGEKKLKIVEFIAKSSNEAGYLNFTIKEICDELKISKPTVIATLDLLEEKRALKRVKNGLYKLNLAII